jgi:hypothetical protein
VDFLLLPDLTATVAAIMGLCDRPQWMRLSVITAVLKSPLIRSATVRHEG